MEFSRRSRTIKSVDPSPILPNFEPIKDLKAVLVTYKNENNPIQK